MLTSRRELLDDFLDFVGEQNDVGARNTAERLLNRSLHALWLKHPWRQFVMPAPLQVTLVANQRSYALPAHFGRVNGGRIRSLTSTYDLVGIEAENLQMMHPEAGSALEVAGRPELYQVAGTCGVEVLLAAAEALTAVSDSAADNGTVVVTVEGYDASARWRRQSVALTGTAPVAIPVNVIPWTFTKAYTAATTPTTELTSSAGTVTLTGGSSGALQSLLPYESAVEHQVFTVFPKPDSAGDVLAVPYLRRLPELLYDSDGIPQDWDEAVFEEMLIQWRVNTGELSLDTASTARPKFLDLLAFENANKFGVRRATRPFTG